MASAINRNDPRTQLAPILTVRPKSTFFRDFFFKGGEEYFPTENVEWDTVLEGAPLARFVGDDLTVEATERTPFKTSEIKTPIFEERRVISARDINKRAAGENIFSSRTDAERAADLHAKDIEFCLNSIDNRIEVMCSQFITSGAIPVTGLGVNREIDYGIPNKEILTGTARWGQPGVNILNSLREKVDALGHLGFMATEAIMSPEVWQVMYNDSEIQKLLDIRLYEFGSFKPEQISRYGQARPVGMLSDPYLTLYTQNAEYGPRTNRARYLPAGMILIISEEAKRNKLGFGAYTYMDESENWQTISGRYIQQFFKTRRPPREEIVVTSRSVPIPGDVESWYVFQVL